MKLNQPVSKYFALKALLLTVIAMTVMSACDDETSKIGPSIAPDEINITIDSLVWDLGAKAIEKESFDSKNGNLLIGNLDVEEYGSLACSFVTRFMCAPSLNVPDSLFYSERVDSCKFVMLVNSGSITGDSLAPQKISVFGLTKQLPSDINNLFDPEGYYNPSEPLGNKSFVVSNISMSDSLYRKQSYVGIEVPLNLKFGKELFEKYKEDPEIFQWPQTFAQYLPGFYVKQTFGRGCVANIANAYVALYYNHKAVKTNIVDGDTIKSLVNVADSVIPLIVAPEVLSSNNVKYSVAESIRNAVNEGDIIITTPCGYHTTFNFPLKELVSRYESLDRHLSTISDLTLTIPAEGVANSFGLGVAPNLLLIKTSEVEDFFNKNKLPDGVSSFTAAYSESNGSYEFMSLRNYILPLLTAEKIEDSDLEFTILPVDLTYETVQTNFYYGTTTTYVTKCVPYAAKPTVTKLNTDKALIVFSFTSQMID